MSAEQENTTALCFPRKIGTDIGEELLKCGLPNIYVPSFQKHRESVKSKVRQPACRNIVSVAEGKMYAPL